MLTEKIVTPTTANNNLFPEVKWYGDSNFCLVFNGSCLKEQKTFNPSGVINLFIVYELDTWLQDLNADFTLNIVLFGIVKLTKNNDPYKFDLNLILVHVFHIQILIGVKMLLFLE